MKKTLSFLMGALLAAMLPVGNAMAQVKTVQIEVSTMDQVALASATIYGDTVSGRTYFVDSTLLAPGYTGDLVLVDTLPYSQALTVSGNTVSGSVDSAQFGRSMIVITDVNGIVYVVGNVSDRTQGVFQASNLFIGTTTGLDMTGASAVRAGSSMLKFIPMISYNGNAYSAFKYATVNTTASDTLSINYTSPAGFLDTVYSPVVLNLATDTVNGALHIAHTTGTVTIMGGKINMVTGSTDEAALVLKAIDSLGYLNPGNHATTIESGNYMTIAPATGANIQISGGNFAVKYPTYTANRFAFGDNTGANAAIFPFTIIPGYSVTWHNWNFLGADTTIVYNQPDNRIRPVLASPYPATCDTVINGRFVDTAFTISWNFTEDSLTQDTNIYVRWAVPTPGATRIRFAHSYLDATNSNIMLSDTTTYYEMPGTRLVVNSRQERFYTCDNDSIVIESVGTADTVCTFTYTRRQYTLTWDLNGGSFTDGFAETQLVTWGADIDYTHTPVLEGHTFDSWDPSTYTVMPQSNLTLTATYADRLYGLTWTGVGGTTPYTGSVIDNVSATYTDDNGDTINAILRYVDANGNSSSTAIAVGSYRVIASSPDPNYHFNADTVRTIVIVPATLTVVGTTVEDTKLYDGSYTAVVTNPGTLVTVYGSDDVQLTTTALFTDATPGEGKTIVANYTISGADVANYVLDTNYAAIVVNSGVIVAPILPNVYYGENGGGYQPVYNSAYAGFHGFCTDTATVTFKLTSGNPDQYKLAFNAAAQAEGFADVAWTATLNDTTIQFNIPTSAKAGDYSVTMTLREAAYPQYESAPITINFSVGLDKDYVTAIFGDVLTIVNKGEVADYDQYSWYCNGNELGYYGQYYQDPNGLSSSNYYYVQLTNSTTGAVARTCPQSYVDVLAEDQVFQPTVSTYPNPATETVNVNVQNSANNTHTLRVMNVMGQTVYSAEFEGTECNIDFSSYAQGSYTITVDGTTVRVIKK